MKEIYDKYVRNKMKNFTFALEENLGSSLKYDPRILEYLHYLYFKNECHFDFYYFLNISNYLAKEGIDCNNILEFTLENFYDVPYAIVYKEKIYVCGVEESYISNKKSEIQKIKEIGGVVYRV